MITKRGNLESLVQYIYQVMSDLQYHDIFVQRNATIKGKSNVKHEIDVYYDFVLNGQIHRVLIECKDWKKPVSKGVIMELSEKINDVPNSIGIAIATNGFQKGAIEYANHNEITLLSGDTLNLLSKALIARLGILLPSESTYGEPFWTIMEYRDDKLTGTYINVGNNSGVDLFISKKTALEVLSKHTVQCVVRGVSRHHLKFIVNLTKLQNKDINLFMLESERAFTVEPQLIEDYFISD